MSLSLASFQVGQFMDDADGGYQTLRSLIPEGVPPCVQDFIMWGLTIDPQLRPKAHELLNHKMFDLLGMYMYM